VEADVTLFPALVCGGGMVVCFVLMRRMHGNDHRPGGVSDSPPSEEITALREEVSRLRAEVRDQTGHDAQRSQPDRG